jgi:phospholipid/cholesterol/gamma-HCH transport system ATP-binding protein
LPPESRFRDRISLLGRGAFATARALRDTATWTPEVLPLMRRLGVDSIPIAAFLAVFTGIVLALLARYIFTGAVPHYFVGTLVTKAVLMELGPVLTGMALAGRVGANVAAELGTMRVTEQVDALETLSINPASYLVVPRVVAALVMFPVVTAIAMTIGVTSGWLTSIATLDIGTITFLKGARLFYPLQGHLVRPGESRELRRRCSAGGRARGARDPRRRGRGGTRRHAGRGLRLHGDTGPRRLLGRGPAMTERLTVGPSDRGVRLVGLVKRFGARTVLDGLDLEIPSGQVTAIIGRSGTGKSVLLKHIVGLLTPDEGRVVVDGADLAALDEDGLASLRRRFGYVFQFAALFDSMTIGDNIRLGLRRRGLDPAEIEARVRESLQVVALPDAVERLPSELSGGMRKRAGIARAIALRPDYILFDEPTTGLDPVTTATMDTLMQRVRRDTGATMVVVSHDMKSVFAVADRIAMLHEGRIRAAAPREDFRAIEDPVVRDFLEGRADAGVAA